jgi:hypothetical protein
MSQRPRSKSVCAKEKADRLIGTWVNGDEYETNVEYVISKRHGHFEVRATDRYDAEIGEVRDIAYNEKASGLSFTVYWKSTGRLVKVLAQAISPNRISYTYTFTESQMWFRKGTEPDATEKR